MKQTTWGLSAMTLSLLFGTIISVGSLIAPSGQLNTDASSSYGMSLPTILVSCLDPLAIVLEITAIILIVRGRRQFEQQHHRLAWTAAILYVVWASANLLGFLPLTFLSAMNGSLTLALAGQWIKAFAALLAFLVPMLLIFGFSSRVLRLGLMLSLCFSVIGSFGVIALAITHYQLEPIVAANQTLYVAKLNVDYTQGLYPILILIGHSGGILYLLVYAYLAWQTWQGMRVRPTTQSVTI